jgi:SAM-dependent methyltransferase
MSDPQAFWDERARENALYFVDSRLDFRNPDPAAFWAGGEEVLDAMLAAVGASIDPADRVLDLGCGVGRVTRALAGRAAGVIGLDVSGEMLARARELNPGLENVEWVHGDGRTLRPLENGSLDGCFSHVVFQHIPEPETTLGYVREMARVLRPGGWALFQLSTDPAVHAAGGGVRGRLGAFTGRGPRGRGKPEWIGAAVDVDRLRASAVAAALDVEKLVDPGTQFTTVYCRRG